MLSNKFAVQMRCKCGANKRSIFEKYGSGIENVRYLLEKNGNKEPKYILHEIETKVIKQKIINIIGD